MGALREVILTAAELADHVQLLVAVDTDTRTVSESASAIVASHTALLAALDAVRERCDFHESVAVQRTNTSAQILDLIHEVRAALAGES